MDSREPREDHELAACPRCHEQPTWGRIHYYDEDGNARHDDAIRCLHCHYWFYVGSDKAETMARWNRRPSPVAESTPTDATAETYRCLACGSNNHEHRCTERKAPVEVEGACDLCAGECRGHSLGHEDQWTPEPGSRAALATELATLKQQLAESTPSPDTEGEG